jgi:hypothetical protein
MQHKSCAHVYVHTSDFSMHLRKHT